MIFNLLHIQTFLCVHPYKLTTTPTHMKIPLCRKKIYGYQIIFFIYKLLLFLILKESLFSLHFFYSKQAHIVVELKKK